MTELIKQAALSALRGVHDPCSIACNVPMDVVEMGLVQDIVFDTDGTCRVHLVLTSITCFQFPLIEQAIENAILSAELAPKVEIVVIHDQLWSPAMMAERARLRVEGIRRASQAVTGTRKRQWKDEAPSTSASKEPQLARVPRTPLTRKPPP